MAQLSMNDGDLFRKSLRTVLVMVGVTLAWLGLLSGVVVAATGTGSSEADRQPKEKVTGSGNVVPGPHGPAAVGGVRSMHRPAPAAPAAGAPGASGDPI